MRSDPPRPVNNCFGRIMLILEGYAVLPSVEYAQKHNAQLVGLGDDEHLFGSDYEYGDDVPEGVLGEVRVEELDVS